MARMLRHKETGELFVYTDLYAQLPELELVAEDPVAQVIAEVTAQNALSSGDVSAAMDAIPTLGAKAVGAKQKPGK